MNIQERQKTLIAEFSKLSEWEDRYKKIIELGKTLPEMSESLKIEQNIVKGCQSQVWLHAELSPEGTVRFQGDSDALLVRGLVGILLNIYSNATPMEILATPPDFLRELGFEGNLSPSRANGLHSMLKQIKMYALAFQSAS